MAVLLPLATLGVYVEDLPPQSSSANLFDITNVTVDVSPALLSSL